jgi:hypothetical protein
LANGICPGVRGYNTTKYRASYDGGKPPQYEERRAKARPLQTLRAELASGEIFQGAEASVEFGEAGQALRGLG